MICLDIGSGHVKTIRTSSSSLHQAEISGAEKLFVCLNLLIKFIYVTLYKQHVAKVPHSRNISNGNNKYNK